MRTIKGNIVKSFYLFVQVWLLQQLHLLVQEYLVLQVLREDLRLLTYGLTDAH